jgi:hypothetical protein
MPKIVRTISLLALLAAGAASAQSTRPAGFLDRAIIKHGGTDVTVLADDSTPLLQAIAALRLEYGWQINSEGAPGYSRFDVVDDTAPKWRAAHPSEKGVTRPAGGLFTASFPEPSGAVGERDALARLIDAYNATGNPGKYVLRVGSDGQMDVIGTQVRDETGALQEISPLLDTPITLAKKSRNVYDTIESILEALHSATGKKVLFAVMSGSLFINTQVTMGGESRRPARELLKQALAATQQPLQYDLGLNPDVPVYILSVSPVLKEEDDRLGGRTLVPAGPSKP